MLFTFLFLRTTTASSPGIPYSQWVNAGGFVNPKYCEQAIAELGLSHKNARCVIMTCFRLCTPQYVEAYPNKVDCEAKVVKASFAAYQTTHCVPIAK